ncbi:MAG: hypothetical protein AB7F71_20310, partial [Burkholderiaceae bacterium]
MSQSSDLMADALADRCSLPIPRTLLMVLPLMVAVSAMASSPPQITLDSGIPGFEQVRIVVPAGTLADRRVVIGEISSRAEPSQALDELERHWRRGDDPMLLRLDNGPWQILSRRTAGGFETAQLRARRGGGSEGYLTRWRDTPAAPASAARGPSIERLLPFGARILQRMASTDETVAGVRHGEMVAVRFDAGIDEVERAIDAKMASADFRPMRAGASRVDIV